MLQDSPAKYGLVSRFFHWLMAILIFWQALKLGDRINDGEHWVGRTLVPWHISIGVTLLVLVVLRALWAWSQLDRRPAHEPATAFLVYGGHVLLYAGMLLMPITGLLYMIGNGYGIEVFGMQLIEQGGKSAWMATLGSLHAYFAWALLLLIAGHITMALYHGFVKRDDILRRMRRG